jgi:hypothetical protein
VSAGRLAAGMPPYVRALEKPMRMQWLAVCGILTLAGADTAGAQGERRL